MCGSVAGELWEVAEVVEGMLIRRRRVVIRLVGSGGRGGGLQGAVAGEDSVGERAGQRTWFVQARDHPTPAVRVDRGNYGCCGQAGGQAACLLSN